jgi:hypothetical protein
MNSTNHFHPADPADSADPPDPFHPTCPTDLSNFRCETGGLRHRMFPRLQAHGGLHTALPSPGVSVGVGVGAGGGYVGVGVFADGDVPRASAVPDAKLRGYGTFADDGGGAGPVAKFDAFSSATTQP